MVDAPQKRQRIKLVKPRRKYDVVYPHGIKSRPRPGVSRVLLSLCSQLHSSKLYRRRLGLWREPRQLRHELCSQLHLREIHQRDVRHSHQSLYGPSNHQHCGRDTGKTTQYQKGSCLLKDLFCVSISGPDQKISGGADRLPDPVQLPGEGRELLFRNGRKKEKAGAVAERSQQIGNETGTKDQPTLGPKQKQGKHTLGHNNLNMLQYITCLLLAFNGGGPIH